MHGPENMLAVMRSERERGDPHPVYRAFRDHIDSRSFARDEVRRRVVSTYMGLVSRLDDTLIVVDPGSDRRGQVSGALVKAIDLIPTFLDALGQPAERQWLEGRSLLPGLRATGTLGREAAFSELNYAFYPAAAGARPARERRPRDDVRRRCFSAGGTAQCDEGHRDRLLVGQRSGQPI